MSILCEEQAGFRKHYSTTDHIFNLKCLIDMHLRCNKTLFCAFIDYRKAFDSVDRCALWHKLLQYCIDGKMLKIIHNMYESAKSCVRLGTKLSDHFYSNVGVRQGENLFPVLFSLFLNDLVEFIGVRSLFRQPIIPTSHCSDGPLFRQPIAPTAHFSDNPLFRQKWSKLV
jgi:hypothetical protein